LCLVDVTSNEVPVHVKLEAFNPCVPLSAGDSAIPMIIFNYTVTNPNDKAVKVIKPNIFFLKIFYSGAATNLNFIACR
jgi:uncharacterized protein (DUF608 family)